MVHFLSILRIVSKFGTLNSQHRTQTQMYRIGYDAVFCAERFEPFVVDAYNSTTGRAETFKVVGKGGLSTLDYNYGERIGSKIEGLDKTLTSTNKYYLHTLARDNFYNLILKVGLRTLICNLLY